MGKRGRRGEGRQKRKKEERRGGLKERVRGEREKGGVFSITIIFSGHFTSIPSTGIFLLDYKARRLSIMHEHLNWASTNM